MRNQMAVKLQLTPLVSALSVDDPFAVADTTMFESAEGEAPHYEVRWKEAA
jgi:hypothetical protein